MKTIDDARELRRRIFGAFEMAELSTDPVERERFLTMAIVGAGPTGVELAGQIRELAVRCLKGEFRNFDPASVRVLLLDGGKEPLAGFGHRLSGRAARCLERLGVELRMNARVVGVDATGVDVVDRDGMASRIDTYTTIWAAGVQASPLAAELAKASGANLDRAGRIAVQPDLTLPGHPEVFAVGDMTSLDNLPGVAEVAMQGGLHAANSIARRLSGKEAVPFKYRDLGSVATIGRFRAIASVRKLHASGFLGWLIWFFVHLAFLSGFGNRLTTMLRWLRSMIGRGRAEREFSTAHTGGDLSLPSAIRAVVEPKPVPDVPDVEPTSQTASPPKA
jgi:NADH dehydrogenase